MLRRLALVACANTLYLPRPTPRGRRRSVEARARLERRDLLRAGAAIAAARAAKARADPSDWYGAEGILTWVSSDAQPSVAVAKTIDDAYYGVEFVTYLSRFLLNYDRSCAAWWADQVRAVPRTADSKTRLAFLGAKFAAFADSVEYGLRRYPGAAGRAALLRSLEKQHGEDAEKRRHLALAFTLLKPERQPVEGIGRLLEGVPVYGTSRTSRRGSVGALLPPAFSPGLADYLEADPLALLPRTQRPVFADGAWEVRGLAPVLVGVDNVFGRRGERGAERERALGLGTYASFAAAGLAGCALTHAVLVPIDVVKTRQQTDPRNMGVVEGARAIARDEGWEALFLGAGPTLAGYCYYGLTVYPGYEFFSRGLNGLLAPAVAQEFHAPVVLLAGALATLVACVGVCPAEALRIRVVADPARFGTLSLAGQASLVAAEEGAGAFYAGFPPLVVRQVIFGMVKFFFFDSLADAVFAAAPVLEATAASRLGVSTFAGLVAGTASSLISQPADAVLSRINARGGDYPVPRAFGDILDESGPGGFYRGAAARCAWSGLVISGQFAIYDLLKSAFAVAGPDLTLHLDLAL